MMNESMRNSLEVVDLLLTQSLERYQDMEPGRVPLAVIQEWGPQTAVLLDQFIAAAVRRNRFGLLRFVPHQRNTGGGSYLELPRDYIIQFPG